MTQEERKTVLIDLCARLPYNVVIRCTDSDTDYKCFLTTDILNELLNNTEYYDYKPYLRPMSSMTEEEEKEFWKVVDNYGSDSDAFDGFELGDDVDWLNEHHFDYRGLIPMGLALEAPEGMYENF